MDEGAVTSAPDPCTSLGANWHLESAVRDEGRDGSAKRHRPTERVISVPDATALLAVVSSTGFLLGWRNALSRSLSNLLMTEAGLTIEFAEHVLRRRISRRGE